MKVYGKSLFVILVTVEIVVSAALAQAIDLAAPNLEANVAVVAANDAGADIASPPSDQSAEPRIPTWLITAIIFIVCILIMGGALRRHKCCCGPKKFP